MSEKIIKYRGQIYIRQDSIRTDDAVVMLADLAKLYSDCSIKVEKSWTKAKNAGVPEALRNQTIPIAKQLKALAREVAALRAANARASK